VADNGLGYSFAPTFENAEQGRRGGSPAVTSQDPLQVLSYRLPKWKGAAGGLSPMQGTERVGSAISSAVLESVFRTVLGADSSSIMESLSGGTMPAPQDAYQALAAPSALTLPPQAYMAPSAPAAPSAAPAPQAAPEVYDAPVEEEPEPAPAPPAPRAPVPEPRGPETTPNPFPKTPRDPGVSNVPRIDGPQEVSIIPEVPVWDSGIPDPTAAPPEPPAPPAFPSPEKQRPWWMEKQDDYYGGGYRDVYES
jgi:hypothetical protein